MPLVYSTEGMLGWETWAADNWLVSALAAKLAQLYSELAAWVWQRMYVTMVWQASLFLHGTQGKWQVREMAQVGQQSFHAWPPSHLRLVIIIDTEWVALTQFGRTCIAFTSVTCFFTPLYFLSNQPTAWHDASIQLTRYCLFPSHHSRCACWGLPFWSVF